jgi:hypothetical protein
MMAITTSSSIRVNPRMGLSGLNEFSFGIKQSWMVRHLSSIKRRQPANPTGSQIPSL